MKLKNLIILNLSTCEHLHLGILMPHKFKVTWGCNSKFRLSSENFWRICVLYRRI